ncbi:ATP-dependent nuclease [Persephonella sp.]
MASELLHLERKDWEGLKLALIEEIEAHLHPQIQLRIIESLQEKNDIQLIMTTHSPNIGSKIKLKNLFICHNGDVFPMGQGKTKLDESDYKFLERFLDVTKANMFFAKGVILVEGWAEELILPSLAKKIGINLTEKGISIVNVGNTAFLRYCKIFQREDGKNMSIPVAVITDLDIKPDEYKQIDSSKKTERDFCINGEINKRKEKLEGQSVKVFVSPHWTLEYCLMLDNKLRGLLIDAIKSVFDEEKKGETTLKNLEEEIEDILNNSYDAEIATHLYHTIFVKRKISKASAAQYFAELLENNNSINKEYLENIESIQYLLEAIKYVSGSE